MNIWAWITIFVVSAAIAFFIWRARQKDWSQYRGKLPEKYQATTPKGVKVASSTKITAEHLRKIDAGLDLAFQVAETLERYTGFQRHTGYKVWLFPRSGKCEQAGIYQDTSHGGDWDQTEYDKNPEPGKVGICYAGKMVRQGGYGTGSIGLPGMVVVDDLATLETVVCYEAEHNILLECDMPRYERTMNVHYHPIFGSTQAFKANSFKCGQPEK
jgi:hypothetical protein